jgi:hypothetical protein
MSDNKPAGYARRKNRINQQFSVRLIEMLESPAYRALSVSGHRFMSRVEIELAAHGGNDNGKLPVTYQDFIDYGMDRGSIAPASREVDALGFVKCTRHGRGGNAEHREPNLYRLTFAHARNSRQLPPTHEWRRIKTLEEAMQIAAAARAKKSPTAVAKGRRANRNKNRNRCGRPTSGSMRKTHTETEKFSMRKTHTTGPVQKPTLLSISRVRGEAPSPACSSAEPAQGYEAQRTPAAKPEPANTADTSDSAAPAARSLGLLSSL